MWIFRWLEYKVIEEQDYFPTPFMIIVPVITVFELCQDPATMSGATLLFTTF